jgi:hypothetical protein
MENDPSDKKRFIINIMAVEFALIILSALFSLFLNTNFGVILFFLGILVGILGAYLGGPNPSDPNNPNYLPSQSGLFRRRIIKNRGNQISYDIKHSMPGYEFENAILFAGLIAIVLSLPFICQIMF